VFPLVLEVEQINVSNSFESLYLHSR